ncbi:amino acid transporter [Rhizodiscina lignyota]|uniref:Amino acid transporter n=1 Tax=Rhizodiscina lignyota TaxID=1504668 RepID=A0A9P4MBY0_9PEZI|nr:amino acid transporter [Rhizodiscina lignyota]
MSLPSSHGGSNPTTSNLPTTPKQLHGHERSILNPLSDEEALKIAGKKQVLKREWNFWACLGLAATTLTTWEGIGLTVSSTFLNGGPVGIIYGFIICLIGVLAIMLSLAEMASISPIAGAQYHWTAEHAPPRFQAFFSYVQGWLTVLAWQAALTSIAYLTSVAIQTLIIFNHASYDPKAWHLTVLMIGLSVIACVFVIFARAIVPHTEMVGGSLHVYVSRPVRIARATDTVRLFFFLVVIGILATSHKAPSADVWTKFIHQGWPHVPGISFCIGFLSPALSLAGADGVVHLSEETFNANRNIPRAMWMAVAINGAMALVYIIVILYAITDLDAVLNSPAGAIAELYFQATRNKNAANAMLAAIPIIAGFNMIGMYTSLSRLIWAFARDNGLPFSRFISHISPWNSTPNRAVLLAFLCTCILGCINLGNTTAFNSLLSLSTIAIYFSYGFPIALFFTRRFSKNPPVLGPWNLGRWGPAVNVVAILFGTFLTIFLPFPPISPITAQNFNWSGPMLAGVMILAIIDYFVEARHRFTGPLREIKDDTTSDSGGVVEQEKVVDKRSSNANLMDTGDGL